MIEKEMTTELNHEPWSEDGGGLESVPSKDLAHHTALMFLPAWRARAQEEEMNDHEPRAIKVEDLIIDEDTGEVLEMPEGVTGELVEFLTFRLTTLQDAERAYKQAIVLLKLSIKRELEKLDLKSLQTIHGRPVMRRRVTRKGKVENLHHVMPQYELSIEQVDTIFSCASALDIKKLEVLAGDGSVPREAIEALIEETESEWVQVSPILKEPPVVERVTK